MVALAHLARIGTIEGHAAKCGDGGQVAQGGTGRSLDVTSGTIWRQLLRLSVPVLLSSLCQQTYALANTWVVGRFAGKDALAAIQATVTLSDLVVGFSMGVGVGCGIVVSQLFGAHEDDRLSRAVHTAMGIALVGGTGFSLAGFLMVERLLRLMGTPAEIFDEALAYARVYALALVFSITFNMGSALQRAVGDTRTPSVVVAGTSLLNVALDLLFVGRLGMGAVGCGYATALTLAAGTAITLVCLMRAPEPWRLHPSRIRLEPHMTRLMVKTGLPLGVQISVYSVSNIIAQSAINSFGTDYVAAWGLSSRLDSVIWMVSDALGTSVTTFAAQNFGARDFGRMRQGLRTSLAMTALVVGGLSALLVAFGYPLSRFFVNDPGVDALSTLALQFIGPFYVCYSLMDNIGGTIRGAGESVRPMLLTILGTCVFRVIWLLVVVPVHHTFEMVLVGYPVTWILTGILFVAYYRHGHWLQHAADHEREHLAT